jgi:hypothetical protein
MDWEPTEINITAGCTYWPCGDQLANVTACKNTYKQKIPFETELKMKGELMTKFRLYTTRRKQQCFYWNYQYYTS